MKRHIAVGHTNKDKYIENHKFYLEKVHTGFNHRVHYANLRAFDFVPKLFEDTPTHQVGEAIDGTMLEKFSPQQLAQLAQILRTLHKSSVELPRNNFRERFLAYLKTMPSHNKNNVAINAGYKKALLVLANMRTVNPCHNDFGYQNLLYTSKGKFFVVDGEYAAMGDKHFDLAFFIESAELAPADEKVFLDAYNAVDDELSFTPNYLARHKFFVNYFTLCGALAQPQLPFPTTKIEARILKLLSDPTIFTNKF